MLGNGLVVAIPPGTYPVKVTIADVSDEADGSHLRESYLSVIIHDGDPVVVENVRPEGVTDQEWLDAGAAGEYFGIGVDAGTVGFADAAAIPTAMPEGDWYEDVYDSGEDHSWFALMDSRDHLIPGAANVEMPLATNGENVVLSHSGWGDGFYPVLASYARTAHCWHPHRPARRRAGERGPGLARTQRSRASRQRQTAATRSTSWAAWRWPASAAAARWEGSSELRPIRCLACRVGLTTTTSEPAVRSAAACCPTDCTAPNPEVIVRGSPRGHNPSRGSR